MSSETGAMITIATSLLSIHDAHQLAPLVSACVQERKRGAPAAPDQFYAELLLNDRTAEIVGARLDERLAGFAVFFDLPDMMTGRRTGQLNEFFVAQSAREQGVEHALLEALTAEAKSRDWLDIRWLVPEKPPIAKGLAERFGKPGAWAAYTVEIK
jgi:GNAT superfamily N-acetyltransferase